MLKKTIYGLVQSARKFNEELINVFKVIGFYGSKSDPCLWTMWDEKVNHMIIIGIYVDDFLIIGKNESIDCLIDELKKHELNLKVENNVNEYLSCCIEESKDEAKLTMIQPHLLTCLIQISEKRLKEKGSSLLLEHQGLKYKGQKLTWMFLIHNLKGNTDLELACYCI
jgi:hypothetical protein